MKAIITKYLGPTNFRGSRIKAKAEGGSSISISYPHELTGEDAHRKAAELLANKYNWLNGKSLHGGCLPDCSGYAFVFVNEK